MRYPLVFRRVEFIPHIANPPRVQNLHQQATEDHGVHQSLAEAPYATDRIRWLGHVSQNQGVQAEYTKQHVIAEHRSTTLDRVKYQEVEQQY